MAIAPCFERGEEAAGTDENAGAPVLVCYNKVKNAGGHSAFNDADSRVLNVYGRLVGAVKSYVATMRAQQGELKASRAVIEIGMTLSSNLQGQNLHYNITSLARQLVPCEWSTLWVCDDVGKTMHQVREDGLPGVIVKIGEGVAGSVAQAMEHVRLPYIQTDPRFVEGHYGERASRVREILAFPLIDSHGELKAVLELVNRLHAPAFRKADERELLPFCKLAGITLHNSRMLQVARRTGDGHSQRVERRNSMIGVRRSSHNQRAAAQAIAELSGSRDVLLDPDEPEREEPQGPRVELGLLSSRKMRASIY